MLGHESSERVRVCNPPMPPIPDQSAEASETAVLSRCREQVLRPDSWPMPTPIGETFETLVLERISVSSSRLSSAPTAWPRSVTFTKPMASKLNRHVFSLPRGPREHRLASSGDRLATCVSLRLSERHSSSSRCSMLPPSASALVSLPQPVRSTLRDASFSRLPMPPSASMSTRLLHPLKLRSRNVISGMFPRRCSRNLRSAMSVFSKRIVNLFSCVSSLRSFARASRLLRPLQPEKLTTSDCVPPSADRRFCPKPMDARSNGSLHHVNFRVKCCTLARAVAVKRETSASSWHRPRFSSTMQATSSSNESTLPTSPTISWRIPW
mmetsp:Transcript_12602/g.37413  ORF Transcript_12602/g.37413 Transcript_12602/m.37413 type:complete len:324 (-) Transcript_12602:733-1704(-)